ncbi:MAG: exosortase/archaeosortase family protein [Ferruginibacter sp.]|nr:exosortase/archaeosortase family protein [Ferruginibacter sp.]
MLTIKNSYLLYFIKFVGAFCILYFGTKAIIGLTVPGGYYSPFIARYLDYPSQLRFSLLNGSRMLVAIFGFDTYLRDAYHVNIVNGRGVHLVYACLGYGLLSFWIAFIFANNGRLSKKVYWMLGGCVVIWLINVSRISIVLVAANKNWDLPLTLEHHTLFNIIVYAFIFLMIGMFNRSEKKGTVLQ